MTYIHANANGNGTVDVYVNDAFPAPTIPARVKKHPWDLLRNNRRIDVWFSFQGTDYHGQLDENRTVFRAYPVKRRSA